MLKQKVVGGGQRCKNTKKHFYYMIEETFLHVTSSNKSISNFSFGRRTTKKGQTAMVTFSNEFHKWLWSNISKTLPFLTSCQEENVLVGTRENFITKSCFWKIHLWLACLHSSQKILNQKENSLTLFKKTQNFA